MPDNTGWGQMNPSWFWNGRKLRECLALEPEIGWKACAYLSWPA